MPRPPTKDQPFAELPSEIELSLDEVAGILAALDRGAELATGDDLVSIRRATRLITQKVWPELGELLDEGEL